MANSSACVKDPSVYENIDFESWSTESYGIAITLYDGKIIFKTNYCYRGD